MIIDETEKWAVINGMLDRLMVSFYNGERLYHYNIPSLDEDGCIEYIGLIQELSNDNKKILSRFIHRYFRLNLLR